MTRITRAIHRVLQDPRPLRRLSAMAASVSPVSLARFIQFEVQGFVLGLHPSHCSVDVWYAGQSNPDDYEFLTSYLHEGDVYIDVGANIGTTVIPAAQRVGLSGSVLAFEPHPRVFRYLQDNVRRNGLQNVEARSAAVGDHLGKVQIADQRVDDENEILLDGQGLTVELVSLDTAAAHLSRIALVKIDVEGYELFVVEGATACLARTDCVYFELSALMAARYEYGTARLLEQLQSLGFQLFHRVLGRELATIDPSYQLSDRVENAFAIRDVTEFAKRTGWLLQ